MPRNASGTYTLPSGNPVVSGTLIEANWANTTLNDIANELTDSLSRSGEGGMLAPFRLADGLQASPGIAWLNEPSTGFYREGSGEMWGVVGGAQILQYTATGVLVPTGKTLTANGGITATTLTTSGAATLASASVTGNLSVGGTLTLTGGLTLNGNVTVGDSSADTLTINSTITSNLLFTDNTYDIGASGATRPRNLYLAGDGVIGGTLGVTGVLTASAGVSGNLTGNVTGNVTGSISGGTVAGTTGTFSSNVTVGGTLGVTGATTLSSTLGVTGAITASGGVSGNVTGNLTGNVTGSISGGTVAGSTGSFSSNVTVGGTLGVTGVTTLSNLTASTALALDASKNIVSVTNTGTGSNVLANSPTLVTPNLGTPSAIVLTNASGTASININGTVGATTPNTGAFTTLSATGNVTLGDATSDTITANGRFNTDLVPSTDNARDLGTSALQFKDVYGVQFLENGSNIVSQVDIGTAPNEVPLNQYLGTMSFQDATAITVGQIAADGVVSLDNAVTINESGADVDFRIEGDTDTDLFFVDASADYVGIGKNNPTSKLDVDGTIKDSAGSVRIIPAVGSKTASYTLATADVGKFVEVGSGGSITIPDATFAGGDAISIFNNTTGDITITCTITTAYIAGEDADKATMTLATRGVATILFISGTVCVVSGNVS